MPLSLAGTWTLHDAAGVQIGPCPIPGDIHSALIAAGRIADPMIGRNEAAVQWVAEATWEIRRRFTLDGAELVGKWAVLDLEFLDTFADLIINGFNVGRAASSFMRHRLDVSDVLRAGENEIALRFVPAAKEAQAIAARQPFPIPRARDNRVDHLNMIRKAQCHAGWDWGPCLMVIGAYAEPKLHLFDGVRIEHAVIRQKHHGDGKVTVTADVELAAVKERTIPPSGGRRVTATSRYTRRQSPSLATESNGGSASAGSRSSTSRTTPAPPCSSVSTASTFFVRAPTGFPPTPCPAASRASAFAAYSSRRSRPT